MVYYCKPKLVMVIQISLEITGFIFHRQFIIILFSTNYNKYHLYDLYYFVAF